MRILKPKKLLKGDTIGLISPASPPINESFINSAINYLESLGYSVKLGKHVANVNGYLAGTDKERADDLMEMFADKNVKAIFTTRGGYGTPRLLDLIDYSVIRKNPKILVGMSDMTALQLAIFNKTKLITFAGPMFATDLFSNLQKETEDFFWKILTSSKKIGKIKNLNEEKFYILNKGRSEGRILGGNLSMIVSLLGTGYLPSFKNSIFLLEEIGEQPYRIDRMFNQLRLSGIFNKIEGVVLGRFVDCYEKNSKKNTLTLNEIIVDYLNKIKIPVLYNLKHGHIAQILTIPLGLNTKLNASRGTLEITEAAVV